jgi:hypothetical protein
MSTNLQGTADLPDSACTRLYFMSSRQHGTGSATSRGHCQQFQNPLDSSPVQRALALDKWATQGTAPPPSCGGVARPSEGRRASVIVARQRTLVQAATSDFYGGADVARECRFDSAPFVQSVDHDAADAMLGARLT